MLSIVTQSFGFTAPDAALINAPETIAALNSDNSAPWAAGFNPRFEGMTYADAKPLLGTTFPSDEEIEAIFASPETRLGDSGRDVPTSFDARDKWGSSIQPIRDQVHCAATESPA